MNIKDRLKQNQQESTHPMEAQIIQSINRFLSDKACALQAPVPTLHISFELKAVSLHISLRKDGQVVEELSTQSLIRYFLPPLFVFMAANIKGKAEKAIVAFLQEQQAQYQKKLMAMIYQEAGVLKAGLYHQGQEVEQIPTAQLIAYFTTWKHPKATGSSKRTVDLNSLSGRDRTTQITVTHDQTRVQCGKVFLDLNATSAD